MENWKEGKRPTKGEKITCSLPVQDGDWWNVEFDTKDIKDQ